MVRRVFEEDTRSNDRPLPVFKLSGVGPVVANTSIEIRDVVEVHKVARRALLWPGNDVIGCVVGI